MKTLDEVIAALEDEGVFADALHYLKEYKIKRERIMAKAQDCEDTEKRLQDEIARYQEAVKNCEIAENKYIKSKITYDEKLSDYICLRDAWAMEQENPPLTWDELRTMEGKPVWYEHEFWKGWIILGKVEQGATCEMIPDQEERWYIVKDGNAKAYRKERE